MFSGPMKWKSRICPLQISLGNFHNPFFFFSAFQNKNSKNRTSKKDKYSASITYCCDRCVSGVHVFTYTAGVNYFFVNMRFLIFNPDKSFYGGEKDQSSSVSYLAVIQGVCLSRKSNCICIAWLLKYCLPQGVSHSPQMQNALATLKPSRLSRKSRYTS